MISAEFQMEQTLRSGCTMSEVEDSCREHQQSLTVFCLDDLQPLCPQCAEETHSEHRVYLLSEAAADCKGELNISLQNLRQKKALFENVAQDYNKVCKHNQVDAEVAEEQIRREFEELHQILQKEEADRLLSLREEKDKRMREIQEQSKVVDEVVKSLEERIRLTEAELHSGGDGVQFLQDYKEAQKRPRTDWKRPKKTFLMNVAKHLNNLKFSVWNKIRHSAPYSPVTLDAETAGQGLSVSVPQNSVHCCPAADPEDAPFILNRPERFHPRPAVLAREVFSTGLHSWDIEIDDCDNWTMGVAHLSVPRRVNFEACPEAGLWCIGLRDGQYLALTNPAEPLPDHDLSKPLRRINVRLDLDNGVLEFHDADTCAHLYTFIQNFPETLCPYFESSSECGSLSVVPQEAGVSVGPEGGIEEDEAEDQEDDRSETCSESKENKIKKTRIVKKSLTEAKATNKSTAGKILFSNEYHVSLFRLQKVHAAVTSNQIKHG